MSLGKPTFKDDYDFDSPRNAITLCGDKNQLGTCHWAFDRHCVGILYNGFTQQYEVYWYDKSHLKPAQLDVSWFVAPSAEFNPYGRGLAFHALAGAAQPRGGLKPGDTTGCSERIQQLAGLAIAQEESKDDLPSGTSSGAESVASGGLASAVLSAGSSSAVGSSGAGPPSLQVHV